MSGLRSRMNVQISPLQTPPVRDDERDARDSTRAARARSMSLAACAGAGRWSVSGFSRMPARRAQARRPRRCRWRRSCRDMRWSSTRIGTVVANATVQVTPRVTRPADQGLFQGRPDRQDRRSALPDRSAPLSGGLRQGDGHAGDRQGQGGPLCQRLKRSRTRRRRRTLTIAQAA